MTYVTTEPAASGSAGAGPGITWTVEGRTFLVQLANPPANQLSPSLVAGLAAAARGAPSGCRDSSAAAGRWT
jgi:hypothetical protein